MSKTIPKILEYNAVWRAKLPSATQQEIAELAVSTFCVRRTDADVESILVRERSAQDILRRLYDQNLDLIRTVLDPKRTTVAFYLHEHAPFYNQQQIYLLRALRNDIRYNVVTVFSVEPHPIEQFDLDAAWFEGPILRLPDASLCESLEWIDVVIALDFCASRPVRFPKRAKRIVQPHGTDIKFQYSVEFYGAGLMFDYLLAPSFAPDILADDYRTRYYNVFPRSLIDHQSRELRLIPFGSPKLDEFIRIADGRPKRDIIYNISLWGLETSFVQENLTTTIRMILKEFPDRRLVFRCFPGEQETVEKHLTEFRSNAMFYVSSADSYIEDYASGAVLLYHQGSSAEVFALATGSPIIRFDGHEPEGDGITSTQLGYVVRSHGQLIATMRTILNDEGHRRHDILSYRNSILPNAGRSIPYLLDCIERMMADEPQPEWKRVLLYDLSEENTLSKERVLQSAEECHRKSFVIPMLASKSADVFPDEPFLQYLATKGIFEHIYPGARVREPWIIALKYLAQFLRLDNIVTQRNPSKSYAQHATTWLLTVFPERFIALIGFAFKHSTDAELDELRSILAELPLDALDPAGIPQMLREYRERPGDQNRIDRLMAELVEVKVKLGVELLHQGKCIEAEGVIREAQMMAPHSPTVLFLLAHALKGQQRYSESAQILEHLLQMQPGLEDVRALYLEVRSCLGAMG